LALAFFAVAAGGVRCDSPLPAASRQMVRPSDATLASIIGWDDEAMEKAPTDADRQAEALAEAWAWTCPDAAAEDADAEDGLLGSLATIVAEMGRAPWERADAMFQDLRGELRGLRARRRELVARVQALVEQRGLAHHVQFDSSSVVRDITGEALPGRISEACEGAKVTRWISLSEPVTFALDDEEVSEGDSGPVTFALDSESTPVRSQRRAQRWDLLETPDGPQLDCWEHALEALGVARCGVCRMKLPMDVQAIEEHCVECEARHAPLAPGAQGHSEAP